MGFISCYFIKERIGHLGGVDPGDIFIFKTFSVYLNLWFSINLYLYLYLVAALIF